MEHISFLLLQDHTNIANDSYHLKNTIGNYQVSDQIVKRFLWVYQLLLESSAGIGWVDCVEKKEKLAMVLTPHSHHSLSFKELGMTFWVRR